MASACDVLRCSLQEEAGGCNGLLPSSSGSGQGVIHVLAVDDSLVDRKVVERLLKDSSCKVTAVESGTRALQFLGLDDENKSSVDFDDLKVNLIMTDYSMPGMTGYELLKKIKESSAFREIPVVVMSSENIVTHIDRCLEEGAEEFIVKPVKLSDVKRLKDSIMKGEENHEVKRTLKRKIQDEACSLSAALVSLSQATPNDSITLPDCDLVPYESQPPSISSNVALSNASNLVQINV